MSETTAVDDLLAAEVGNPEFVAQQPGHALPKLGGISAVRASSYRDLAGGRAAVWVLREIVAFTPPGALIDRKNAVLT